MPIVRKKLAPGDVYPTNLRYNEATDTVQSLVNGDWVDNPDADPRNQTTLPPRLTANTRCDAAESVKDALKGQIDAVIVAIDNASTAFTIAGIILSIFSFGVFAVLISLVLTIADAMIAAGSSAIEAALTESTYHTFTCILFCQFENNGRLREGGLANAQGEITDQIGGLGATVLNAMLQLAGEGGVNNLASLGTSTGNCSDCACGECDFENWDQIYLGVEVERGADYIILDSVNVAGAHGNHRVSFGTSSEDLCCCVLLWEFQGGDPAGEYDKHYLCGVPLTPNPEDGFTFGSPAPGVPVWIVAVDAAEPFQIKFQFTGC